MNNTIFTMSIRNAQEHHELIAKDALGEHEHADYMSILEAILANAFDSWKDSHDNAGQTEEVVDAKTVEEHNALLFGALRKLSDFIGEIPFADGHSAKLEVNAALGEIARSAAASFDYALSDEAEEANQALRDAKADVRAAEKELARVDFNGVNPETLKHAQEALENALEAQEAAKKAKKEAEGKKNGKVTKPAPAKMSVFRKQFEMYLFNAMTQQRAMSYSAYTAMKDAQKKARREAAQKRKAAKRQAEAQAKAAATK